MVRSQESGVNSRYPLLTTHYLLPGTVVRQGDEDFESDEFAKLLQRARVKQEKAAKAGNRRERLPSHIRHSQSLPFLQAGKAPLPHKAQPTSSFSAGISGTSTTMIQTRRRMRRGADSRLKLRIGASMGACAMTGSAILLSTDYWPLTTDDLLFTTDYLLFMYHSSVSTS